MNRNYFLTMALAAGCAFAAYGQKGGISPQMLQQLQQSYQETPADRAIRHALSNNNINTLAINSESLNNYDTYFSDKVESKGITDQQSSGRCWLFAGLNVLRAKAIAKYDMGEFKFSQNYAFFWDQLEKANLFLQGIIDTREKPMDDKMVEWLFKHPLSDGGQFTGVSDLLMKYGIVPAEVMVETYSSNNTSRMANLISLKLKEFGLELRELSANGKSVADLESRKTEMLKTVYRMLALTLGEPPTKFTWRRNTLRSRSTRSSWATT